MEILLYRACTVIHHLTELRKLWEQFSKVKQMGVAISLPQKGKQYKFSKKITVYGEKWILYDSRKRPG